MSADVYGACSPGLESVPEEFARNVTERGDIGVALCPTADGETVVDRWGGAADTEGFGAGPSCAALMPGPATRPAQYGWSTIWGTTT